MEPEQNPSFKHSRNLSVRSRKAITARRDAFQNFRAKFEAQKKLTDKLKNWQSFIKNFRRIDSLVCNHNHIIKT